ncbi:MAG: protease-like activity factor CPAF [Chlamydiales bacterium]
MDTNGHHNVLESPFSSIHVHFCPFMFITTVHRFYRFVWLLFFSSFLLNGSCEGLFDNQKKEEMVSDLECIKRTMQVQYAPSEWKKQLLNWDLGVEFAKAADRIREHPAITTKDFQQIVRDFLGSTQDYHVSAVFYSTESAALPFSIKTIDGKPYIAWIDADEWPSDQKIIQLGDELIEFDGRLIQGVLDELKHNSGRLGDSPTDQSLADRKLTLRLGRSGDKIPQGILSITTQSPVDGEIHRSHLQWDYKPEKIASPWDFSFLAGDIFSHFFPRKPTLEERINAALKKHSMIASLHQTRLAENQLRYGELGAAKSFLPMLGHPIWKYDHTGSAQLDNKDLPYKINWFAYIYKNEEGHSIGCLRIPHYSGEDEDFTNLLPLIAYLEKHTDALVIDQLNNPGGYVFFMHDLLSLLTPYPLLTPKHQVAINQKEVMEAVEEMDELQFYLSLNEEDKSAATHNKILGNVLGYYQFIIDEWNAGHVLTQPTHIGGVEAIQPHPYIRYTKPILMLINELDFSAGDFAPAILHDNQRAVLMGARTAGAGGAVTHFSFPNRYGIQKISFTETIAERVNLQKIENLGVIPDIEYQLTEEDLRNSYQSYKTAINQAITNLIK